MIGRKSSFPIQIFLPINPARQITNLVKMKNQQFLSLIIVIFNFLSSRKKTRDIN